MPELDRRQLNEDRLRSFRASGRLIAFVCECADPKCWTTVLLTVDEYERLDGRKILAPGHRAPGLDD